MLLGECAPESETPPSSSQGTANTTKEKGKRPETARPKTPVSTPAANNQAAAPRGLDILHATSAALIHALREVLLDSDFENAMKALTAWIPVKDEDLLMKVARAEWKLHQGGGGSKKKVKA